MAIPKKRPNEKKASPPVLSQEFFIANHADVFSCVTIVILLGMMIPMTNWIAVPFVALTSNVTTQEELQEDPGRVIEYSYGIKDACAVVFYAMVCIIVHQIIQEYVIDKLTRRLHLSKLRTSRFAESAQLVCFYIITLVWSVDLAIFRNYLSNFKGLWENYPHARMAFPEKFFCILQIAHWIHTYAELYLQKVKKEDYLNRLTYQTANLLVVLAAYLTNFHRLLVVLLLVESVVQLVFHSAKLAHYMDKNRIAAYLFNAYNAVFVIARFLTVGLTGYILLVALKPTQISVVDRQTGNFNTPLVKIAAFAAIVVLNFFMLGRFLMFHLRRRRERTEAAAQRRKQAADRRGKSSTHRSESSSDGEYAENSPRAANSAAGRTRKTVKAEIQRYLYAPRIFFGILCSRRPCSRVPIFPPVVERPQIRTWWAFRVFVAVKRAADHHHRAHPWKMIKLFSLKAGQQQTQTTTGTRNKKTSAAELRITKDLSELALPKSLKLDVPDKDNLQELNLVISPDEGFWKGGTFPFSIKIPNAYPHEPPKVKCIPKIYHPNIDYDGNVCLNILREDWKPVLTLSAVLYGLQFLFLEPNADDPLNKEAADLMVRNLPQFTQFVTDSLKGKTVAGRKFDNVL
ncbi:Translocating chain-associated membrane protein 1 [Hypsibius exemplaris]|uniref:Translocating chain-associated membrane protein 1 n=1 Tax=Hypsibius exemplaris TaxID=2072580 RepID=A0A1W0X2R4_HYPEX|nr:Translocating chain-associated membrane protein 1 [Hypsibius exemplaris]